MANLSNINNKFLVTTGGNVGIANTSPTLSTLAVGIGSTNSPSQICQLAGSGSGVYSVLSLTNTNKIKSDLKSLSACKNNMTLDNLSSIKPDFGASLLNLKVQETNLDRPMAPGFKLTTMN